MTRNDKIHAAAWGTPGVVLQAVGLGLMSFAMLPAVILLGGLAVALGTGLLGVGCAHYAKGKGYETAWAAAALLSVVGLFVIELLPDRSGDRPE